MRVCVYVLVGGWVDGWLGGCRCACVCVCVCVVGCTWTHMHVTKAKNLDSIITLLLLMISLIFLIIMNKI